MLTKQVWSPYAAGIVIGLLQIPAFLLIESALGTSTAYVTVVRTFASWFDPSIHDAPTSRNWWQVALLVGIAMGAFMSMRLSGARRHTISPIWQRALGSSSAARRYAVAFVGGFLLLIGARIADGCTSGHGLSGVAQLAVGSTVAVAAMFAGGIATAIVFGFAFEKSRVFEPGMIVGQMQLRNFLMLKIFLTAVATGAIALAVLNGLGYVKLQPRPAAYARYAVGGLLLGAAISLSGASPGTTLAQIGVGYRDALFTLIGGLLGAVTFVYAEPAINETFLG